MRNPFTVGKWVRGESFFGRQELLEKVLHGNRNYVWVVGTRRLGKTSMLKQLEYLSHSPAQAGQAVALFWDLQGSRNLDGLREGLLESVEGADERFAEIGVDIDQLKELTVFEILRHLERKARDNDRRLLLLCDECEELLCIEKSAPEALPRLRRALQHGETLRTVLTATRRLGQLERSGASETSPFLQGFVPPLYLSRLSDDEARALIQRGRFEPDDVQEIMDKTDNHPYLLQLVCERLFDGGSLDAVIEEVSADDLVAHFFSVDYEDLESFEKKILLLLQHRPLDADKLAARIGIGRDRVIALLHALKHLGCIKQMDGEYGISNFFLERWLEREAAQLWVEAAKGAKSSPRGLPEDGDTVGHYVILGKLGSGGMGTVYQARDVKLERTVALKVLQPQLMSDRHYVERFWREAEAASRLSHPNITTFYEAGVDQGWHFIAMEYVRGQTLRDWCQADPRDLGAQLEVAIQAARGIAIAHASSVVHRDIKPDNIMVTEQNVVKIMDFGLAKFLQQEGGEQTTTGVILGTIAYMSPEKVRGERTDHRTDIFSFGIVLYELFSGQRPFTGENQMSLMYSIVNDEPRSLQSVNAALPQTIADMVAKALRKEKGERYPRMQDLVAELELARGPLGLT